MISAYSKGPTRPVWELDENHGSSELLAASQQRSEMASERKQELARRLEQNAAFLATVGRQLEGPGDLGADERQTLAMDQVRAREQRRDLEGEVEALARELLAEGAKQRELEALIAEEAERNKKSSVWMVSSLGVPRPLRMARAEEGGAGGGGEKEAPDVAGPKSEEDALLGADDDDEAEAEEEEAEEEEAEEEEGVPDPPLNNPEGVCVDAEGSVYVTDSVRSSLRRITAKGRVQRLAGTDEAGHRDGRCDEAEFRHPRGVCLIPSLGGAHEAGGATLVVCDTENHCLRLVRHGGEGHVPGQEGYIVSTLAGRPGEEGHADGPGGDAKFNMPWAVCAVEGGRALLVCDAENHCVRRVEGLVKGAQTRVSTVLGRPGVHGCGERELRFPWSVCAWGRDKALVGDGLNQRLLLIDPTGAAPAQNLSETWPESVRFGPRGLACDGAGQVYMSHSWQSQVWRLRADADGELRLLERIAGTGLPDHRDGKGEFCELFCPAGICLDASGGLIVADHANHCVRRLRELRAEEVTQKLARFMRNIALRGVISCLGKWRQAVEQAVPAEPLDVVLALAMGTHADLGEHSPLRLLAPTQGLSGAPVPLAAGAPLRRIVAQLAAFHKWRIPRTRKEVEAEQLQRELHGGGDDGEPGESVLERLNEARAVFLQYDKDGGGTIDAAELRDALNENDMEVSKEEVQVMVTEFGTAAGGEITFSDFCRIQGIPPPPDGFFDDAKR